MNWKQRQIIAFVSSIVLMMINAVSVVVSQNENQQQPSSPSLKLKEMDGQLLVGSLMRISMACSQFAGSG